MQRTTVYLTDELVAGLRQASAETGKSQAELIREGVQAVVSGQGRKRVLHSLGVGSYEGPRPDHWEPQEVYDWVSGKRPR